MSSFAAQNKKPFLLLCMDKPFCDKLLERIDVSAFEICLAYNERGLASDYKAEPILHRLGSQGARGFLIVDENTADDTGMRLANAVRKGKIPGLSRDSVYTICVTGSDKSHLGCLVDKYFSYSLDGQGGMPLEERVANAIRDNFHRIANIQPALPLEEQCPPPPETESAVARLFRENPGRANWLAYKEVREREEKGDEPPGAAAEFLQMLRDNNHPLSVPNDCNFLLQSDCTGPSRAR